MGVIEQQSNNMVTLRVVSLFFLFAASFLIPISSYLSVRFFLIALVITLFLKGSGKYIWGRVWDIFFYLIVLIAGLLYSQDINTGLKVLETNFSFFAIPLVLYKLHPVDIRTQEKILQSFLLGVLVSSLICLLYAIYRYTNEPNIQFFFFEAFTEVINSHPTYLAYYIIFSITIELYNLYHSKCDVKPLLHYLIVFFLFIILILTGGQTAFISMLFVFSFFILKFLTEERDRGKKRVIGGVIGMLICMFLASLVEKGNLLLVLNDSWERASLWKSAIAATSNIFIGVGTGDYKVALNDYYTTHGMALFALESYNAHNQFIQILFSNGLLGLFSVLMMIGRPLYIGLKTNNILSILCIFPFLIYGITEVFLGRYQGVVFFALVHQVFLTEMNQGSVISKPSIKNNLNVKTV